ncbi:uncharacterized protein LOC118756610, partial [Rhagoletis pomonella]|uniref:uncharacterized protein LOC118756610 n=1 Tax=Rhagoletis pomonella TaxID=28610 RepID=UPI00178665A9
MEVLKPLGDAVDFLQGDKKMVYGYLLPTLATIFTKYNNLIKAERLVYFCQIVSSLTDAIKERFKKYFELKEDVSDAITASALCPDVKLQWVNALNPEFSDAKVAELSNMVRKIISTECAKDIIPTTVSICERANFFDFGRKNEVTPSANVISQSQREYCNYISDPSTDIE